MTNAKIIPLDRAARLLKKTEGYQASPETFLSDVPESITTVVDALPHADDTLLLQILPLLGTAGKERVLAPLAQMVCSPEANDVVRRAAALQLGLAASMSGNVSALQSLLTSNLKHPDPAIRSSCALALGWDGNRQAVEPLMERLQDPDRDVQAAVIAALSSIGDLGVYDQLTGRLTSGAVEEKRSILLNLWRFAEQTPEDVQQVYLACLKEIDEELLPDIVSALPMIATTPDILDAYRDLLTEGPPSIRTQVMENLAALDLWEDKALTETIYELLTDKDEQVRQAAIRLLAR